MTNFVYSLDQIVFEQLIFTFKINSISLTLAWCNAQQLFNKVFIKIILTQTKQSRKILFKYEIYLNNKKLLKIQKSKLVHNVVHVLACAAGKRTLHGGWL